MLSQVMLAKLMGVSPQEVEKRIEKLLAHCDQNGIPRPITVTRRNGNVQYRVVPARKGALARVFMAN